MEIQHALGRGGFNDDVKDKIYQNLKIKQGQRPKQYRDPNAMDIDGAYINVGNNNR